MLNTILSVIFVIVCAALTGIVLMQEGKQRGLGSIGGIAESYWGKIKGRSVEVALEKGTTICAVLFMVIALVLNIIG